MTTEADRENARILLAETPLVWREEKTGRVVEGGDALTRDELESRIFQGADGWVDFAHSDDAARVGATPYGSGIHAATWYRGTTLAQDLAGEPDDVRKAAAHGIEHGDADGFHYSAPTRREIAILAARFEGQGIGDLSEMDVQRVEAITETLGWVMGWSDAPEVPEQKDDDRPETPDDRDEQEWKYEQMRGRA